MFSFFKRGKSKEDGDKKEKSKDKQSFSPFTKRHDSNKREPPASCSVQPPPGVPSSPPAPSGRQASRDTEEYIPVTVTSMKDPQHTQTPSSNSREVFQTKPGTPTSDDSFITKDEQQLTFTSSDRDSAVSDEDCCRTEDSAASEVFERAGSNGSIDRTEGSDSAFKTAPNTPVLSKHLTIVTSEVLIDSPELPPDHQDIPANFPEQAVELPDLPVDPPELSVEPLELPADPPEPPVELTNRLVDPPNLKEDLKENAVSAPLIVIKSPTPISDAKGSFENDLEFSLTSSKNKEVEFEIPESTKEVDYEPEKGSSKSLSEKQETNSCQEAVIMCEEVLHGPGELYDIAEEETSEEEEEKSDVEDDDDDDDDEEDSGNVTQPTIEEEYPEEIFKKNLVNQETQRVGDLTARLCMRELESNRLLGQIEDLRREVMVKTGGMDRLQAELSASYKESDCVHKKLRKLEEELDSFKQRNAELQEEIQKRSEEMSGTEEFDFNRLLELEAQVKELSARVKDLEEQLQKVKQERDILEQEAKKLEMEREEEKRIVQEALDDALAEKEAIQSRFEKDFEKLRTVNTDREQQLLDDFEWKLREVEQACKRRLEEKEKFAQQRIKAAEEKLKAAEQNLAQLEKLKEYESEAEQLRGLNLEQQRALRFAERTKEQLQVSEKVLQEEVKKMKELLDKEKAALTTMQGIHNREIDEKDRKMKFRLEQQKTELNNQWEEKLRKETIRLRIELDQINRDEKKMVLEAARVEKEGELLKAKEKWEKRFQDLLKEVETLKQKMSDKEDEHKNNIENVRTNADRDIFELRRKLDRIDLSYQEKIERMQNEHERDKERLLEESERKLQTCEQGWQLQMGSTRTTLELVKEQLKREAADQVQALNDEHRRQMGEQWERLMQERDEAMAAMEDKHQDAMDKMRTELETIYKCRNSREQELLDMVSRLREEVCGKAILVGDLSTQAESLQDDIQELNKQISSQDEQFQQTKAETEKKLREMEGSHGQACLELQRWRSTAEELQTRVTELTKQLDENKDSKLVEDLRKALSEKEHQVAQLSKEKHLYQLELMNRNCHGDTVTARQRRKGGRGKPSKPGPSRGHK